jgi:hypothetical protein
MVGWRPGNSLKFVSIGQLPACALIFAGNRKSIGTRHSLLAFSCNFSSLINWTTEQIFAQFPDQACLELQIRSPNNSTDHESLVEPEHHPCNHKTPDPKTGHLILNRKVHLRPLAPQQASNLSNGLKIGEIEQDLTASTTQTSSSFSSRAGVTSAEKRARESKDY